ncbi:hypothetical protein ACFOSC_18125 [Streptantibioticus rubrisoli]|uniref:Uncharacterized protein n=1 Tax=Streptantibioticus rubrisoli TaxID=1387313 RepID=A0ABT1PGZ9_9ACTN|nr:hypothetical protein [Streptantibioticus rubrisoli]MCQ4044648.1 hypothetical protein [Streptantibioticus rubrisoli]
MAVTVSLMVLLLILLLMLLRSGYVRFGSALVCVLFGFFLASTGIAPTVNHAVASVIDWANSAVR